MADRFLSLFKVFRGKNKKGPGAAPAQQPEDPEQFQTLQDNAALDKTQEQEPGRRRFRKTLQPFWKFLRIRRRKTGTTAAEGPAEPDSGLTELQAEPDVSPDSAEPSQDSMNEDRAKADMAPTEDADMAVTEDMTITNANTAETQGISNTDTTPTPTLKEQVIAPYFKDPCAPSQPQVPAIVRRIHQRLLSKVTVDARLQIDIVRLAEERPDDLVLTLLRCAPTCDRAAAMMWRAIGSSGPAVEKVLPTLLIVMASWPLHSICTSDGDDRDIFALTATLVIWVIVQVPECHEAMILYSSRLFVTLLFHIAITTQQMPPLEASNFWKACQEEHRLPSKPNRFAVQAMKALLCRLRCDHVVVAMERKRGWDTLLCAHTQHYAVGLLAREMRRNLIPLCSRIALHLLRQLNRQDPYWDLPFLAFLVEVLEFLDLRECGGSVVKIMARYLHSKCRERHRLALRGLVVLSKDLSMARRICCLSPSLLELLGDADGEVVSMTLHVFTNVLQHKDILVSSTTAPKLAEALLLLFDHDNSHVQVLSIHLFCKVMELVVDEGKTPLKTIVNKSLDVLVTHCHAENCDVAKASRETLLRVAGFLKRRKLEQLLKKQPPLNVDECLLAEDRSRAAEHLRRALRYLQSPQEPLREAAIRIMGEPRALAPFPARRSSAPAPPAAPAALAGPGAPQVSKLRPGLEASQDRVSPLAMLTRPPQPLRPCSKSSACLLQVPAIVRRIHQRLLSKVTVDARLQIDIVRLAEERPDDLVLTLLRCAPTCDRAAAMMWRAIGSSGPAVEKVLPTLLIVMASWPLHSICTSDGDDRDIFALTATLVIWVIVQVPECHEAMILYSSRLFVTLLFHIAITTQQMPPLEASNFWKACQEEHRLPSKPNRFAVQAMKALLCRLRCDHVVVAMERKRGWDTLLCAHTQHYAVGLLAREMRRNLIPLCSRIALHLLRQLNRQDPYWDLPFLAFLVEVLEFLDLRECGGSVVKIMARYLHSKCRERHRLALRGLVVLSKDLSMARRICCLSPSLLELLGDADGEVVSMTLHVFTNVLQHKDILVSSTTAPKLAEALLLLFDHDNSHVQVLSIHLFCKVMELVVDEGKTPLKTIVNKSLDVLVTHCHAENCDVAKVPAIVRRIHQRLLSKVTVDARLQIDIVRLAEERPDDLVLTLLRCAPTCDRAAAMMWRTIGSSGPAVEKVLPTLLIVMASWPLHSICTSDGDDRDIFALTATLVIWVIVQVPECHEAMILYSSRLFVTLLFHIAITTQQMPPLEASNFWKACQEEHRLPSKPNRFAVQAMKALLCRLRCDHVVVAMERKRGWDTLLCAHTQHYAVGLLAREMRRNLIPLCSRIALHLLRQLNRQDPYWDLPFLAFLVEVLEFLDLRECGGSVVKIMARYLHSKCRERHRLALRGLVVLSKDLSMARRICCLSPSLLELLGDADGEVVSMTLHVFTNVLQHKDILVSSTTAPKLAEALLLLFDHDNSHVQVLSIHLFCKVMELVVDEGKTPLKTIVNKSLDVLVTHCHAENCDVAKASRETLLRVAGFLKRRKLEQLLKKQPPLNVDECLLAEDRSRAAEHLRRALRYLQSPQEPLREAAIRIMGEPRALAPFPARRSSAPAPPAAPAALAGPGAPQVSKLRPGLEASQDRVSPLAMLTRPPQPLRPCSKSSACLLQVPAIVRRIHQRLLSKVTVDARLQIDIVRLAEERPDDLVLTLLRCAPTCDRAAAMMWRTIGSSGPAVEKVLPTLLIVMASWPLHSICTSDGDDRDIFALTATLVIWVIVQVPECHEAMILYSSRLFVTLLFHIAITTQQMPPLEASNFWKACQEEHRLPSKPNRFAVQAMKALLCRLRCDHVVVAMERKRGWDTLLCAHTQHYAVGLLAREMRRNLIPLCSRIALHLLRQLNRQDPYWDLPFLAFLVEVLEFLDLRECGGSVVKIMARYLHSKCRERHRLALRGLVVLSKDLSMARRICCLSPSLLELLGDADGEVVSMTLHVFTNVLQHKDILVSSTTAPKLAEALLLLFDHDNSHVQVLSIHLFCKVMELVVDEGKTPLKTIVNKSLDVLVTHCHAENCDVAKASRETLLRVAGFLKRRKLEQLLKKQPPLNVDECLLAEDRSRAAEHLRRALRYLQSPQEPLREAAIRIMGEAGAGRRQRPAKGLSPHQPLLPCRRSPQLAEDRSRAAEHLRRALRYLQSPQEPLREAAIRIMGEPRALAPFPARRSSAPAPPAAPAALAGPG
ncbi:unnamed protein product, partial [Coccothraustes coccothraustes]